VTVISSEVVTKELIDEMLPMLEEHRKELTAYKDIKLNVDYERYIGAYNIGMFRVFVARDENNSIVGYVAYFINNNAHYSDYVYAIQDVLYVDKSRRGGVIGAKLLKYADNALKNEHNVSVVTQHTKVFHDIGPFLEKMGYEFVEKIYMKRLK
jgi:GNAT superfamily N-acetyltransferase